MSVLPKIPDQIVDRLNKIMNLFLWNERKPKISLSILQANKTDAGMGLVNFEIKDDSLKVKWIQMITTDSLVAALAYRKLGQQHKGINLEGKYSTKGHCKQL